MPNEAQLDAVLQRPKLLFFGGSFDPVHLGHTILPFAAAGLLWGPAGGWGVVFVPAARSPHKDTEPTPDGHRLAMLRIALGSHPDAVIWTHELELAEGPSYWVDTWASVRSAFSRAECRFLIGADQARAMHRWSRYRAFWRDAVVVLRGGDDSTADLIGGLGETRAWSVADLADWESMIVRTELVDASSTAIRSALADEAKRKTRIEGLDPGVQEYILAQGLYR